MLSLVGLEEFFRVVEGIITLVKGDRSFVISTGTSVYVYIEVPGRKLDLTFYFGFYTVLRT